MTKERYMALADMQTVWTNSIKPWILGAHQTKVVNVSASGTKTESPVQGQEISVMYVNTAQTSVVVTIAATNTVKTPTGQNITITIPVGGYGEANFVNIGGTIYARGV